MEKHKLQPFSILIDPQAGKQEAKWQLQHPASDADVCLCIGYGQSSPLFSSYIIFHTGRDGVLDTDRLHPCLISLLHQCLLYSFSFTLTFFLSVHTLENICR